MEHNKISNSPEFAYWLGVIQTDGSFGRRKQGNYYFSLIVSDKSIRMFTKFVYLSRKLFKVKGWVGKYRRDGGFISNQFWTGCTSLQPLFKKLNITFKEPVPPSYLQTNIKLFGSYLAGVIDGDGNVTICRPQYPQCYVRIYAKELPTVLIKAIRNNLKCSVFYYRRSRTVQLNNRLIKGSYYTVEFRVIPSNFKVFSKYILPSLQITHKRNKIKNYIEMRKIKHLLEN